MEDITATRIRERRIELGMTQEELAILSGYSSRSTINKVEKDTRKMPIVKVVDIANALHCSPAYLMGWDEETFGSDVEKYNERQKKLTEIQRLFDLLTPDQQKVITDLIRSFVEANK